MVKHFGKMCPTHEGHSSGCNMMGESICECAHDTGITGWVQNPTDPESQASFAVMLLSSFLKTQGIGAIESAEQDN